MKRLALICPSVAVAALTAWVAFQSMFLSGGFTEPNLLWLALLLGPFLIAAAIASIRRSTLLLCLAFATVPPALLSGPAILCIGSGIGESCQYFLALSPIYLWPVVALIGIPSLTGIARGKAWR